MRTIAIATFRLSDTSGLTIKKANSFNPQSKLIDLYQWTEEKKKDLGVLVNLELIMEY